uniref:Uncharacterized protein n=1 Tax=Arundo donax TaxID=35708 RepID=A0A0A8Z644_ARUDO
MRLGMECFFLSQSCTLQSKLVPGFIFLFESIPVILISGFSTFVCLPLDAFHCYKS